MPKLAALLAQADDDALRSGVYKLILAHHGDDIDISKVPDPERTILLVDHVAGIVGNGGFRYLFEGHLPGDPDFALTLQAFQVIGAPKTYRAVRETLALFPNSRPQRDISQRLRHYLSQVKAWPTDQDNLFYEAKKEREAGLTAFIRAHAKELAHLDGPPRRSAKKPARAAKSPPAPEPMAELPHWKRVAFAARCARRVHALLARYWPDLPGERARAVLHAIELAEQSAAQEQAVAGLKDAQIQALMVAGAALATHPEYTTKEPKPRNAFEGGIAAFAAKAAEKAAEAAHSSPEESAQAAREAWGFARNAASTAEDADLVTTLEHMMAQVSPASAAAPEVPGDDDPDGDVRIMRGQWIFLVFTVLLVLSNLFEIGIEFVGPTPVRWWRGVMLPCGNLLALYALWRGDFWLSWLVPVAWVGLGGYQLIILAQWPRRLFAAGGVLGLIALVEISAGLVFLLAPSVRAFFRSQRRPDELPF